MPDVDARKTDLLVEVVLNTVVRVTHGFRNDDGPMEMGDA